MSNGTLTRSYSARVGDIIESFDGEFVAQDVADAFADSLNSSDLRSLAVEFALSRVSSMAGRLRSAARPKSVSTKVKMIRDDYWPKFLATPVALPGGYKPLGDCSPDELEWLADRRAEQAAALMVEAGRFRQYARMMRESGVTVLRGLSAEAGYSVLEAA